MSTTDDGPGSGATTTALAAALPKPRGLGLPPWSTLWAFGRPHTIVGTTLSVGAIAMLVAHGTARGAQPRSIALLVLGTWLAALAANVYIVGLNQIVDVAIDRINKPALPLPAGRMTRAGARRIVLVAGAVAIALGAALGPWLLATLVVSMAIGTAYSLPPTRLKGSALGAPASIALVRGPIANLGLGAHLSTAMGGLAWPLPAGVVLLALFMTLFCLAIGVAKDLPDVAGDRAHAVGNLAVRAGARRAFAATIALLAAAYVGTAVVGAALLPATTAGLLALGHGAIALGVLGRARRVDADDRDAVRRFYRALWRLFYAEYVLLPAVILAASAIG